MCPKSPEQFEVVRQQSRRLILDAALRLFANEGYHAVSVSKIATQAGVSKGLMYNYFSSKEALLKGIIDDALEQAESEFTWPAEASPKEQLRATIDYVFLALEQHKTMHRLLMALTIQMHEFNFIHDIALAKLNQYKALFTDLFSKQGYDDPEGEALILSALFDGISLQYMVLDTDYDLNAIKNSLTKRYLT